MPQSSMSPASETAAPAPRLDAAASDGDHVTGLKIALTSPGAQRRVGAQGPIWGWLSADMEVPSGGTVTCREGYRTRAEPELVFVLGNSLSGPGLTRYDVLAATAAICPGLEIPATPLRDQPLSADEFAAANAGAHQFVVGSPARDWQGLDLALLGVLVEADGQVVSSGAGAAVLGHPADAIAQVANELARREQRPLLAGQFIFAGSMAEAVTLRPGMFVDVSFAHLGHVSARAA
jgi:2-keto-4-pentenoate hydratase